MLVVITEYVLFFSKQKTAYEMRISDWSSDVCSSDLRRGVRKPGKIAGAVARGEQPHQRAIDVPGRDEAALQRLAIAIGQPGRIRQRCRVALVIDSGAHRRGDGGGAVGRILMRAADEIGRASCREREGQYG